MPRWYEIGGNGSHIKEKDIKGPESEFWEEISDANEDTFRRDRTEEDKVKVAGTLASKLRLGEHQKEAVVNFAERLDAREVGCYGGIRALALGIIAIVVNRRRQQKVDGFEYEDRIQNDEEFVELAESVDVSKEDLIESTKKVKQMISR